jgi:CRP/FNR family transcriptional regulator, cyclic AMP receptor protein
MKTTNLKAYSVLENVIFLKKTSLFSNVKTSELKAVASIAEELSFEKGDEIVKESDVGDSAYIIKEGRIQITKKNARNDIVALAEISKGECFGEMSLFDDEARCATVKALSSCTVLRLLRDDLLDVIEDYPHIAVELIKIFVKRLRAANAKIENNGLSQGEQS